MLVWVVSSRLIQYMLRCDTAVCHCITQILGLKRSLPRSSSLLLLLPFYLHHHHHHHHPHHHHHHHDTASTYNIMIPDGEFIASVFYRCGTRWHFERTRDGLPQSLNSPWYEETTVSHKHLQQSDRRTHLSDMERYSTVTMKQLLRSVRKSIFTALKTDHSESKPC